MMLAFIRHSMMLSRWLILYSLILIYSCGDMELEPDEVPLKDEVVLSFTDPAYHSLNELLDITAFLAAQEISADAVVAPTRGDVWYDGGHWIRLYQHQWEPTDPVIIGSWSALYKTVGQCNKLLESLEDLENDEISVVAAELLGLRALLHYWLMDLYGSPIWITEYNPDPDSIRNTPRIEMYNILLDEIRSIEGDLTRDISSSDNHRFHYFTSRMLLAKMYLNAEVYTGIPEWTQLIEVCDEILSSGIYSLEDNYFDIFKTDNKSSSELIFAVSRPPDNMSGLRLHMATLHPQHQKTYQLEGQPWNGWCATAEFFNSYQENDVRKGNGQYPGNFIYGIQFSDVGDTLRDVLSEEVDPRAPVLNLTSSISDIHQAKTNEGARIAKFEVQQGSSQYLDNAFPIFRLADVVLMKAEALLRLNREPEARVLVNQIRQRAGLSALERLTLDELLAERGRELFMEMHRRTDLIRFGKFHDPRWEREVSEECRSIFPIPITGFGIADRKLTQNECYR